MHAIYEAQGRASVIRVPTPYKVIRPGTPPTLIVVPERKGEPDYAIQTGGLALLLDAKECAADRWPLSHLPDQQAERFNKHTRQCGHAFVLLNLQGANYLLPWANLGPAWHDWHVGKAKRGSATLNAAACSDIGRRLPSCDYLNAALTFAKKASTEG